MPKPRRPRTERRSQIESLETREVMSADPIGGLLGGAISHHAIQEVEQHSIDDAPQFDHHTLGTPDFWLDEQPTLTLEEQLDQIEKSLYSAHQLTGMDHVKTDYGFSGIGQTVAVIDSGIAYDHYALGGGLGSSYRVVGGWDFTEGDADPYDDGTEGSHGTHVAGIVGADDGDRSGVAPGVDLVGLRVFSDTGAGYFSWVESALQWVHANRNSYENPITAVNLSLGTNWNSDSIPAWAMLEDEFAQLKADGIFISVSAGNSFTSYNEAGLSYPAASSHVVPVMSSDDSGLLSYFSQRHGRAISAPGRYIYSTVPDYAGNHNGVTDDWANFSGTSMAAPYVAGASVIIREAMEFVGYTGITQDTIYDHMIATADTFYDSATNATYNRLNVQSAIDALMPDDDFGSSVETAYDLGTVNAGPQSQAGPMNGHIEKLNDADYFTFTAGATGTVTFSASNTTHYMDAAWQWMGGSGTVSGDGLNCTLDVVAGQQYTVALSSSDGLGYYDLAFTAEASFTYTDWGTAATQETKTGLTAGAETYYRIASGMDGWVSVETLNASGAANVELLTANMDVIAPFDANRTDYYAQQGEELFVRVSGAGASLDVRLTNALGYDGTNVVFYGTDGDDVMTFTAGNAMTMSLNGVSYEHHSWAGLGYVLDAGAGTDSITITGSAGYEELRSYEGRIDFNGDGFDVDAFSVEDTRVNSGGGGDRAFMYDTAGDEYYSTFDANVVMSGTSYTNRAYGFDRTFGYASGGYDRAFMYDTPGDDTYYAYDDRVVMSGDAFYNNARGFDRTFGYSSGGTDTLRMYDSAYDDLYRAYSDRVVMEGDGFYNNAKGFARTFAYASTGDDTAWMYDSAGSDLYRAYYNFVVMSGDGFYNNARGFDAAYAYASTGDDEARLYDSTGSDMFRGYSNYSVMSGNGFYNNARGFDRVFGYASTGNDVAYLNDSAGSDALFARNWGASLTGSGFSLQAEGFDEITANRSQGGADTADVDVTDYVFTQLGQWA